MRRATIVLELEDNKFDAMEKVLLNNGHDKSRYYLTSDWERFVISTYYDCETYLECNNNDLNKAYNDWRFDF